jgi:hyperosmotically inducible protein
MRGTLKAIAVALMVVGAASGCRSMTGESVGQNVDDTTVTSSVKAKLVADKAANLTRVSVNTVNGTVYLTGIVDTSEQKTRAAQLASEAKGAKRVVNNLQVGQK